MYERFFRLRERPFALRPDPTFLYSAERHATALTLLEYALSSQDGFAVITGEVGCGKTTLLRCLLERLDSTVTVGLIANTHASFGNVLPWVLQAFGLEYKNKSNPEMHEVFTNFLIAEYAADRRVVLLVDEAQNLDAARLEELRLLSNLNVDRAQIIHTALVGQPELRATLARNDLRQFRQRISVAFHITPLTEQETFGYVTRRLEVAGRTDPLFTEDAIRAIHRESGGIPRVINAICDMALVYGFGEQQSEIDFATVLQVITDRREAEVFVSFGDDLAPVTQAPFDDAAAAARVQIE